MPYTSSTECVAIISLAGPLSVLPIYVSPHTFFLAQGGRRKGSIAIYIEPHHPDILDVLALKRNSGDEHLRAREL